MSATDPTVVPNAPPLKPGIHTTEFWLKLGAILISALLSSGLLPEKSTVVTVLGVVMSMLGALGYTAARTWLKGQMGGK